MAGGGADEAPVTFPSCGPGRHVLALLDLSFKPEKVGLGAGEGPSVPSVQYQLD